ncbi:hypothetical protein HK405_012013 [Cladochytrium tenue]|nr:hypothetical protein HK405_012013 [Cladochytrium tenue]
MAAPAAAAPTPHLTAISGGSAASGAVLGGVARQSRRQRQRRLQRARAQGLTGYLPSSSANVVSRIPFRGGDRSVYAFLKWLNHMRQLFLGAMPSD